MRISLLTPTRNRPESFQRLCRMLAEQTVQDFQHIVICDQGAETYNFLPTQTVIVRDPQGDRHHSVLENYKVGLWQCAGEVIAFVEDDDIYLPRYLETFLEYLEHPALNMLVGLKNVKYYNVANRTYQAMNNADWSPLACTAFRRPLLADVIRLCDSSDVFLDRRLWKSWKPQIFRQQTTWPGALITSDCFVGVKGNEENPGVGNWHRQNLQCRDPQGDYWRTLVGPMADWYSLPAPRPEEPPTVFRRLGRP